MSVHPDAHPTCTHPRIPQVQLATLVLSFLKRLLHSFVIILSPFHLTIHDRSIQNYSKLASFMVWKDGNFSKMIETLYLNQLIIRIRKLVTFALIKGSKLDDPMRPGLISGKEFTTHYQRAFKIWRINVFSRQKIVFIYLDRGFKGWLLFAIYHMAKMCQLQ